MNSKILMVAISIVTIAYPVIVFFGLQHFSPSTVAICLLLLIATRLGIARNDTAPWVKWSLLLATILLVLSAWFNSQSLIRFYPVVINCTMMVIFGLSLLRPPTVIETLARLTDPDLPPSGVAYTYKVTLVWTLFFALNATIAAYTAMFTSLQIWTLYNGFIAYVFIGLIFAIEWLIRRKVKAKYQSNNQPESPNDAD